MDCARQETNGKEKRHLMISRRSFLKTAAAVGIGVTTISKGVKLAVAQYEAYDLSDATLLDMYDRMLNIRWYDRAFADKILTDPDIRSYGHIWYGYSGQEAVGVGVCTALNQDDFIQCTHRSHGGWISKGGDLKKLAAEMTFKATGQCQGFGGTMHIVDNSIGYLGANGIVGPGALLAAGAAFGFRAKGTGQVAVNFAGEGTYPTGGFHVAMNEATLYKLPFINVIENNLYNASNHYTQTTRLVDIADAAAGYGIPGHVVDGQDVLSVYKTAKTAVDRARAGEGPTLIEAKTYRYYDHSGASAVTVGQLGAKGGGYRPQREINAWMARDPITLFGNTLLSWGVLTESAIADREEAAKQRVAEALAFADASPVPTPESGLQVFVNESVLPRNLADCPLY